MLNASIYDSVRGGRSENRAQKEELLVGSSSNKFSIGVISLLKSYPFSVVVSPERNCHFIWAAPVRGLLGFGKGCSEMLESLSPWYLVSWWELRAGSCNEPWSFSGLLCFTEEASGSFKVHHF